MAKSKMDIPPELLLGSGKQDNPILTLLAFRVMETAQRRSETVQVGPTSETGVPFSQMWAGVVSWIVGTGGNMAVGYMVLRILGVESPTWTAMLATVLGTFVLGGLLYLVVVPGLRQMEMGKQIVGILVISVLLTVGLGYLLQERIQQQGLERWQEFLLVAGLLAGSGCMVFGYMNVYRMASELANPLYPESPQLKAIKPFLGNIFNPSDAGPQVTIHPVRPVRVSQNGQVHYQRTELPELPPGPPGERRAVAHAHFWTPDPMVMNDIWFALFAAGCGGLSRGSILENPRVQGSPVLPGLEPLPGGEDRLEPEYLGRSQYDRLLERGEGYGWWRRRGQRLPPEQLAPWSTIRAECEAMWREMTGGALPIPDYWHGSYDVQPVVEIASSPLL